MARTAGFRHANARNTLTDPQRGLLSNLGDDANRMIFAQSGGRAPGSDTAQNLGTQALMANMFGGGRLSQMLGGSQPAQRLLLSPLQKTLNLKVKYRESFRPFAPAVLRERVSDWFEIHSDSPYMLLVANVKEERRLAMTPEQEQLFGIEKLNVPRSSIPAVTHVDYSARIQTVHADTDPLFHGLLKAFEAQTGCPVLVNTSFNVRGEPIVCTPEDAFRCFMGTELDVLSVGHCYLRKTAQDPALKLNYETAFALD